MSNEESQLVRADVLLSVQRALLGAVGIRILAICVNWVGKNIKVIVFVEGSLPNEQREAMEIVGTEIGADFESQVSVDVELVENAQQPLKCAGIWVFVRFGCLIGT